MLDAEGGWGKYPKQCTRAHWRYITLYSVKAVIDTVRRVTGKDFPVEYAPRRQGAPARLISDFHQIAYIAGMEASIR